MQINDNKQYLNWIFCNGIAFSKALFQKEKLECHLHSHEH